MSKRLITLFSFIIVFCLLFAKNINATEITIGSRDEWLNNLKEWTDYMVASGDWRYSNSHNKTYYKDAMAAKEHVTNCALMVVHALQRFGVFGKNNKFWASGDKTIVYVPLEATKKRLNDVAKIYSYNGIKPDNMNFEPGDIALYDGHVNVYIGKKNGKNVYYDAGRTTTVTHSDQGLWKSFLKSDSVDGHRVYWVIRLKYGQTVDVEGNVLNNESDESENNGRTDDPFPEGFMVIPDSNDSFTCQTILIKANGESTEFKKILDGFFGIMQFLAPVIAIALTIIDYMKALSNGDTKKANKRTIIRIVIAVLVVFLPLLLDLLFHLFGLYDISSCGIGR